MTVRELVEAGDDAQVDEAWDEGTCAQFFAVDWREEDEAIAGMCEEVLGTGRLGAEWKDDALVISYGDKKVEVPLTMSADDRHITLCTLNDVLAPDYELRMVVASQGDDTARMCALACEEWSELEKKNRAFVEANFLDPRKLPNIMTELNDGNLPQPARDRHQRMLERIARKRHQM